MGRIFNKFLKKFSPILKTSELPLPLLLQAEFSSLHQLCIGHPHWEYCPGLWTGGTSGNGRIFFCYSSITRQNGQFTELWKDSEKAELSPCIHFVLRNRTDVAPSHCSPPGHIRHGVPFPQRKEWGKSSVSVPGGGCLSWVRRSNLEAYGYLPEVHFSPHNVQ